MRAVRFGAIGALVAIVFAVLGVAPSGATATPSFSATDVTTCNGSSNVTVTIDAANPPPVEQAADIVLLVDDSGSIGTVAFNNQVRPSLDALVGSAAPSATGNHIGVVEFSTGAHAVTSGLLSDQPTIQSAIDGMPYSGGSTYTLDGLEAADAMLTGPSARPGAPKVIIVETDGIWNPATTQFPGAYSAQLRADGVQILAVGVGSDVSTSDLTVIAGGVSSDVFAAADYTGLQDALEDALSEDVPAATNLTYGVTPAPGWTITGVSSTAGTGSVDGSGDLSWSDDSINSPAPSTVTITYTEQHTGTTDGTLPLATSATLGWTDESGTAQSDDFSGQTVAVNGCNRPPVADAGSDQSVSLNGSQQANVTLDGTGSSDPDGDSLTYTWSEGGNTIATGSSPTVSLGIGIHTITLAVSDGEFTSTDDVTITVSDPTPPVVTASVAGTQHNGWYTSNAVVSFSVTDPESAITSESPDCAGATVSSDTAGQTFTCTATSAGGTSAPVSVTVKRDTAAPTIAFGGNAGTYHVTDTVAITCTASDALSGLPGSADCGGISGAAWSFGAGSHTFTRTASDVAGNTGSGSTSFTVSATASDICTLTDRFVQGSAKYQALNPLGKAVVNIVVQGACAFLLQVGPAHLPSAKQGFVNAYDAAVKALVSPGWLTQAQATALTGFAGAL